MRAVRPQMIFLSCGFDAHAEEEVASIGLTDDDFGWVTSRVVELACGAPAGGATGGGAARAAIPIVSVLEGGYNAESLTRAARCHLRALIGGAAEAG